MKRALHAECVGMVNEYRNMMFSFLFFYVHRIEILRNIVKTYHSETERVSKWQKTIDISECVLPYDPLIRPTSQKNRLQQMSIDQLCAEIEGKKKRKKKKKPERTKPQRKQVMNRQALQKRGLALTRTINTITCALRHHCSHSSTDHSESDTMLLKDALYHMQQCSTLFSLISGNQLLPEHRPAFYSAIASHVALLVKQLHILKAAQQECLQQSEKGFYNNKHNARKWFNTIFSDKAGKYPPYVENHYLDTEWMFMPMYCHCRIARNASNLKRNFVSLSDLMTLSTQPEKMSQVEYIDKVITLVSDGCDYAGKLLDLSIGKNSPQKEYSFKKEGTLPTTECPRFAQRLQVLCSNPKFSSPFLSLIYLQQAKMKLKELQTIIQYRNEAKNLSQMHVMMSRSVFLQYGLLLDLLLCWSAYKHSEWQWDFDLHRRAKAFDIEGCEELKQYHHVLKSYHEPKTPEENNEWLGCRLLNSAKMLSANPEKAVDPIEDGKKLLSLTFSWAERLIQLLEKDEEKKV